MSYIMIYIYNDIHIYTYMDKERNKERLERTTGWGPQDGVQLPKKVAEFDWVYGRCNELVNGC